MPGGELMSALNLGVSGPSAVALAIAFAALLRFAKWLIEFVFRRVDVSRSQLGLRLRTSSRSSTPIARRRC
jgi:hypothetical protein